MKIGNESVRLNDWVSLSSRGDATSADGAAAKGGDAHVAKAEGSRSPGRVGPRQCRTCAERKYKDVSNDPTVSFQTPTSVSPEESASAVSAHEQQHVAHNAARAEQQGMTATSTVSIHTAVCPECGRSYVSGGTTTTTYTRKAAAAGDGDDRGLLIDATA